MDIEIKQGIKVRDTTTKIVGTVITTAEYELKTSSVQVETIDKLGNRIRKWIPIERIEAEKQNNKRLPPQTTKQR